MTFQYVSYSFRPDQANELRVCWHEGPSCGWYEAEILTGGRVTWATSSQYGSQAPALRDALNHYLGDD